MAVLRLLATADGPLGVSGIARALGLSKGTVHAVVQALRAEGAVEEAGGRKVRLGPLIDALARGRAVGRTLEGVCRPHLEAVARQTGQTTLLGVPEGDRLRIAEVSEGRGALRVAAAPGMRIPLAVGATGKVARAWATDAPGAGARGGEEGGPEAERIRTDGVAYDREEYLRGVVAAAAPVLAGDRLAGILYAVGFREEVGEEGLLELGRAVRAAARAASRELAG
ncbi:MAG: hypothetical protein Kow0092_04130 [Deferrisomatales bacterium]